ncbi:DMT family transporter [Neisseria leonii]|uniref:DMT family transporter n=1 Tax=Neisseria leonii TaxID=2995413 RepID=A0A9X4IBC5_9NEIS|nr:DMT family transporter [Neisseria sp. 51.81]MDD9328254.1 DMT family transporter [Neisseria sp. 51.81]
MNPQPSVSVKDPIGSAWMVAAALLFTLMNLWVQEAGRRFAFGSGELVFWRMLFSALVLGAWAVLCKKPLETPHIRAHLSRSLSGTLAMFGIFYAVVHLPLGTGVTLSYTSSLFLALFSLLVLKERIRTADGLLLVSGFGGVVLLLQPSLRGGQEWAALAGLGGGALAGWAYMQVRELSLLGEPAWRVVLYFSLVGTLFSALWAWLAGWRLPPVQSLPYLAGIGAAALAAQLAMTHAYRVGRKFTVSALAYLTVVFSSLAGMFWQGDRIDVMEWMGMAVIVTSGILAAWYGKRPDAAEKQKDKGTSI